MRDTSGRRFSSLGARAHPLVLGTVLFLASELMFFAALFASYFELRAGAAGAWPPPGVHLGVLESSIGTALLLLSDIVMLLATRAMDGGRWRAARCWTAAAMIAASGFIALSLHGWWANTFTMATDAYGSLFYTLTGFHLLHVSVGVVLLGALLVGMRSPALLVDRRAGAEALTYYWHFVFVVWLGVWGSIYLIR